LREDVRRKEKKECAFLKKSAAKYFFVSFFKKERFFDVR